jgi:hypothetical protein
MRSVFGRAGSVETGRMSIEPPTDDPNDPGITDPPVSDDDDDEDDDVDESDDVGDETDDVVDDDATNA